MTANTTITRALSAARACIQQDRTALADAHMAPATNALDADGAAGVAEYDEVLGLIDAALAEAEAQPAPRKPLFAAAIAQRKWDELQAEGYRMQSIAFESPDRAGAIDAWGVVRWAAPVAAAPAPQPLTRDQIDALDAGCGHASLNWDTRVSLARAVERAHGIGAKAA